MARPPTVTREATSRWTLAWQGSVLDRVTVPVWLGLSGRVVRWVLLRPVKATVAGLVLLVAWRLGWWAAAGLEATLVGAGAILRSPGVAASGRVGRSYRSCQARGRLRRAWPRLAAEAGLVDFAGRPMHRSWFTATATGYTTVLGSGAAGKTHNDVNKAAGLLAGLLPGCHSVRTRRINPQTTRLMINFTDPLAGTIGLDQLPQVHDNSAVPIGIAEDGATILWNATISTLLLGLPRSGKSSIIWAILDGIQRWRDQPPPDVWAVDLKEGVELSELDPALGGIAKRYIDNPKDAERAIQELADSGRARLRIMRQHGYRKWTPERSRDHVHPQTGEIVPGLGPRILLIVDEFLALPKKATNPETGPLKDCLFLLPAAGITVVGCSQLTQVDSTALGRLRNFFGCKILLAVESVGMVVAAVGEEGRSSAPAHLLRLPFDAGRFYMQQEGISGYVHGKAAYVNDEQGEHLPIARGQVAA